VRKGLLLLFWAADDAAGGAGGFQFRETFGGIRVQEVTDEDTIKICGARQRLATSACCRKMEAGSTGRATTDKIRNIINISQDLEVKELIKIKTFRVCDG
jgi:hypothetical protein